MLEGLTDYIFNIQGKKDISDIVREYFRVNGYDFESDQEDDEDDWDEDW